MSKGEFVFLQKATNLLFEKVRISPLNLVKFKLEFLNLNLQNFTHTDLISL